MRETGTVYKDVIG